jgi:histidinol-phosphatase (PHP family)
MPADYHTHTPLCHHAEGTPEQYIDAALAAGVAEYGISDHAPARPEPYDDWRMLESDLPTYFQWVETARTRAAGRIPVRLGLECEWLPGCERWIEDLASRADWDYLIGSIHYLSDWDFDNPKWLGRWAEADLEETWSRYWEEYAGMARSGLFDFLGHPDLIKKFAYRPDGDLKHFYEPAIEAIASAGCAIELNTTGWHKPCEEQYPAFDFLVLARGAGIPLLINSDAHAPDQVARGFEKAIALAREAGFSETALFDKRQRSAMALG